MGILLLVAGILAVLYAVLLQTYKPRGLLTFVVGLVAMFGGLVLWVEPRDPLAGRAYNARATIAAATAAVDANATEAALSTLEAQAQQAATAAGGGE